MSDYREKTVVRDADVLDVNGGKAHFGVERREVVRVVNQDDPRYLEYYGKRDGYLLCYIPTLGHGCLRWVPIDCLEPDAEPSTE